VLEHGRGRTPKVARFLQRRGNPTGTMDSGCERFPVSALGKPAANLPSKRGLIYEKKYRAPLEKTSDWITPKEAYERGSAFQKKSLKEMSVGKRGPLHVALVKEIWRPARKLHQGEEEGGGEDGRLSNKKGKNSGQKGSAELVVGV